MASDEEDVELPWTPPMDTAWAKPHGEGVCEIDWCVSPTAKGETLCKVHIAFPGYTPGAKSGGTTLKKDWSKREQKNEAERRASRQTGGSS